MHERGVSQGAVPSTHHICMYIWYFVSINDSGAAEAMRKQIPRRRLLKTRKKRKKEWEQ